MAMHPRSCAFTEDHQGQPRLLHKGSVNSSPRQVLQISVRTCTEYRVFPSGITPVFWADCAHILAFVTTGSHGGDLS